MGETQNAKKTHHQMLAETEISWKIGSCHFNQPNSLGTDPYILSAKHFEDSKKAIKAAQHETRLEVKQAQLDAFHPGMIHQMDEATLIYWQLLFKQAFLLALSQYNLNSALVRKQRKASDLALLMSYDKALQQINAALEFKQLGQQAPLDASHPHRDADAEPSRLPCWLQGPYTPCVAIRDFLSEANWYRLYWVWAGGNGGLLGAVLSMPGVKSHYDKTGKMAQKLDIPLNILGYLSWTLYYTRFMLNFLMMIKHLIPTAENKKFSLEERFQIQCTQRKFTMLNDLVWGTVNLVTIYWLTGNVSKMAGAWGGLLTVGLMLFDVLLAYKERREERAHFDKANEDLKQKIQARKDELDTAIVHLNIENMLQVEKLMVYHYKKFQHEALDESDKKIIELARTVTLEKCRELIGLEKEKAALEEEKALLMFDWHYREKNLSSTLYFNIVFVPVMALIVGNVLPDLIHGVSLSVAALSTLTVVGGVLAVLITAAQTYYQKEQTIKKYQAELDLVLEKQGQATEFELARLQQKSQYLEKMIQYERRSQVFSISAQLIFAGAVFGALACSTPVGLGIIGGLILLGIVVKFALGKSKPKAPDLLGSPATPSSSITEAVTQGTKASQTISQARFFKAKMPSIIKEETRACLLRVA